MEHQILSALTKAAELVSNKVEKSAVDLGNQWVEMLALQMAVELAKQLDAYLVELRDNWKAAMLACREVVM